jgi:hypothetical protein
MSNDKIFFRAVGTTKLTEFVKTNYDAEKVLQQALEEAPEVIAGFTTTDAEPTRLLLIKREMPIGVVNTSSTMRIDHLYADSNGIPVLVEVKRSTDTRSRREVIAQLLDYAANAAHEWPADVLLAAIELRSGVGGDVDQLLSDHGITDSLDDFVSKIVDNIGSGHIRMMIVADEIPESLRRIIEFLNAQMTPAEILGVEVPQYVGAAGIAYVPRLVGQTTAAKMKKGSTGGQQWDAETFLERADEICTKAEADLAEKLILHVRDAKGVYSWGSGLVPGVGAWYLVDGHDVALWILRLPRDGSTVKARIEFRLPDLVRSCGAERTESAMKHLEAIPAAAERFSAARLAGFKGWPSIALDEMADESARSHLFGAIECLRATGTQDA